MTKELEKVIDEIAEIGKPVGLHINFDGVGGYKFDANLGKTALVSGALTELNEILTRHEKLITNKKELS